MKLKETLICSLLILLIPLIYAETTFFDNSDDAFIMGNSTTSGVVVETTGGTTGAIASGEVSRNYAKQLFDIKLELEDAAIENSNELSAIIRFESFGNVPTPVNLTYRILNSSGTEVYSEKGNIVVTTEQIVRKNFETLNLPDGKYTLILTTVYGDNVTDEFKQEFSVEKFGILQGSLQNIKNNWILFVIMGAVIVALIILTLIIYKKNKKVKHRRKKQHERFYKKK